MPRPAPVITLDDERRARLRQLLSAPSTSQGLVVRLMIVLKAAQGESNQAIASGLGVTCATVGKWRHAFAVRGFEGLRDRPRRGRPRKYGAELLERVRTGLKRSGRSRFGISVRALAREMNLPRSSLHHLLTSDRRRELAASAPVADGRTTGRALNIRGIFVTPWDRALVVGVNSGGAHASRDADAPPSVFASRRARRRRDRTGAVLDALTEAAAQGHRWKPRRGRAATLLDFSACLAAANGQEELHVVRTGRRRVRELPADAAVNVHDLQAESWAIAVRLLLELLRPRPEQSSTPAQSAAPRPAAVAPAIAMAAVAPSAAAAEAPVRCKQAS